MRYIAKTTRRNIDGKPDFEFIYKHTNGIPVYFETENEALNKAKALCEEFAFSMYNPQVKETA